MAHQALSQADWSRPFQVVALQGNQLKVKRHDGMYHGNWAFRKEAFWKVGGYNRMNTGEESNLRDQLLQAKVATADLAPGPWLPLTGPPEDFHLHSLNHAQRNSCHRWEEGISLPN